MRVVWSAVFLRWVRTCASRSRYSTNSPSKSCSRSARRRLARVGLAPLVLVAFAILTPLVLIARVFGYSGFIDDIGRSCRD